MRDRDLTTGLPHRHLTRRSCVLTRADTHGQVRLSCPARDFRK